MLITEPKTRCGRGAGLTCLSSSSTLWSTGLVHTFLQVWAAASSGCSGASSPSKLTKMAL